MRDRANTADTASEFHHLEKHPAFAEFLDSPELVDMKK